MKSGFNIRVWEKDVVVAGLLGRVNFAPVVLHIVASCNLIGEFRF